MQETDGDRVVELFKSRNKQPGPLNIDLITMDFNMLNMDGDQATTQAILIFIFYSAVKGFYFPFCKFYTLLNHIYFIFNHFIRVFILLMIWKSIY